MANAAVRTSPGVMMVAVSHSMHSVTQTVAEPLQSWQTELLLAVPVDDA